MTRKEAQRFAQAEANMLKTRVWVSLVKTHPEDVYSVAYHYQGDIETPSYCDPE